MHLPYTSSIQSIDEPAYNYSTVYSLNVQLSSIQSLLSTARTLGLFYMQHALSLYNCSCPIGLNSQILYSHKLDKKNLSFYTEDALSVFVTHWRGRCSKWWSDLSRQASHTATEPTMKMSKIPFSPKSQKSDNGKPMKKQSMPDIPVGSLSVASVITVPLT
jgi:hypothetical protein